MCPSLFSYYYLGEWVELLFGHVVLAVVVAAAAAASHPSSLSSLVSPFAFCCIACNSALHEKIFQAELERPLFCEGFFSLSLETGEEDEEEEKEAKNFRVRSRRRRRR